MTQRRRAAIPLLVMAALGTALLISRLRPETEDDTGIPPEEGATPAQESAATRAPQQPDLSTPSSPGEQLRTDAIARLESASPSFRDSTLLVAIHDFEFVCESVTDVMAVGEAPDRGWHVECARGLAYAISVDSGGSLLVTPAPSSVDGFRAPVLVPQPSPIPR